MLQSRCKTSSLAFATDGNENQTKEQPDGISSAIKEKLLT